MRALKVGLALGAAALMLCALTSSSSAQQRARLRAPIIRVYSTSGADYINTSTYVEPQIELSENAYVFAVEMDLDGQIQVLHPDFPGLSVKISAHTNLRLPNYGAGFNRAVPQGAVYSSAQFQRYSAYGGYMDTRGTVLALASRAPFNLDPIESGGDWNISAIRRLIEYRTPLEALSILANYLGAKDEPIGRDFMRFAGGATNSYAYNDYAYYSPCDPYYGYFYSPFGFNLFQALNLQRRALIGQKARVIGFDKCGVPIISYGPVVVNRFPVTGRPPRSPGDTTVFPKGRFPHQAMPRHPSEALGKAAPEGIFPLPRSVGEMGDVTITAPKGHRSALFLSGENPAAVIFRRPLLRAPARQSETRLEARSHSQLLHRRAHRPWQIDARRSADRGHWHAAEARDEGAGARHPGSRARAGHHDQAQRRAHDVRLTQRPGV